MEALLNKRTQLIQPRILSFRATCVHMPFSRPRNRQHDSTTIGKHSRRFGRGQQHQIVCRSSKRKSKESDRVAKFKFMDAEVSFPTDNIWQLAFPALALFAFSAFLGPLVIGIAMSAVAIGAAFSTGLLVALPFLLFFAVIPLMFGGITFAGMLTFGIASAVAKIATLAIAAVGVATGWGIVSMVRGASRGSSNARLEEEAEEEEESEEDKVLKELDKEARQRSRELREFDELLAKNDDKRRVDRWRP